jgi:hypothetical protein
MACRQGFGTAVRRGAERVLDMEVADQDAAVADWEPGYPGAGGEPFGILDGGLPGQTRNGGRAVTLTYGLIGYPRRRFVIATSVAGIVRAGYAFFLGLLGGRAFEDRPWTGLLLALGLALAVSVLVEPTWAITENTSAAKASGTDSWNKSDMR